MGNKEKETKSTLSCLVSLISAIVGMILSGITISILWTWFVAEPFGVIVISLPHAIGIDVLITFLTAKMRDYIKDEKITDDIRYMVNIIIPLMALGTGYVIHLFM